MEQTPLDPATLIADRYEIVRAVAPAGAGWLHVALDRTAGRQVSLEVITSELAKDAAKVSAFTFDVKQSKTYGAPKLSVVQEAGGDAERGVLWIAMDLVEGEGLRARMARGQISPREVVTIVTKLLDALAPAHQRGQPHRSLTPEDVVLVPGAEEDVVVLDFGVGKHVPSPAGSPYVSPEQARASGWVTPAADVFSVGAIAYELIAGKPPDAAAPVPVAQAAPGTPASIATIIDKALIGDPGLRYASAKEMKAALDAAIKPAQPAPVPPTLALPATMGLPSPLGAPPAPVASPPTPGPFGPTAGQFGSQPGAAAPFAMPKQQGLPTPSFSSPQQGGVLPPGVGVAPGPALAPPKQASTTWMWVVGLVVLLGACLVLPVLAFAGLIAYGVSQDRHVDDGDGYHPIDDDPLGVGPLVPPVDPGSDCDGPRPGESFGDYTDRCSGAGGGVAQADPRYDVPVTAAQPQKGPTDALVTIVEFADYQCPFCGRVAPTIDSLLEQYGSDVRFVWRDQALPFHEHAEPSAQLAREAFAERGNAGYWQVHDLLYANQSQLDRSDLLRYAAQAELNTAAARSAIDHHTYRASMDDDSALGNRIGADGTPTFYINGRRVVGAQPREELARVIEEELANARRLVAAGTPRGDVYTTVIAGGLERYDEPGAAPPADPDPLGGGGSDDTNRLYTVAPNLTAPGQGPANAPVVIEEFSDFECPFCKRVLPTLDQVRDHYGSRVRIVWRDYPLDFHTHAMLSAEAAREALAQGGDAKFWRMHELLYAHQDALERQDLEGYAQQIGLDMGRFRAALDSHVHRAAIQRDRDAADATGAPMGTPTFFVNGHLVQGAQPYATFETAVDRELAIDD